MLSYETCACNILFNRSEMPAIKNTTSANPFDQETGNFIIRLEMTPEEYALFAQTHNIAEIVSKFDFNKKCGKFEIDVSLTPDEYLTYV